MRLFTFYPNTLCGILCVLGNLLVVNALVAQNPLPDWTGSNIPAGLIEDEFIFDDMQYGQQAGIGAIYRGNDNTSLFGRNDWFVMQPDASINTVMTRAWYFGLTDWVEASATNGSNVNTTSYEFEYGRAPNRIIMRGKGDTAERWNLSSGFIARTGTWVTRVRLSELPPHTEGMAHYAFWTKSPMDHNADAYDFFAEGATRWDEVNIEISNWHDNLSLVNGRPPDINNDQNQHFHRRISSGITWAPYNSTTPSSVEQNPLNNVFFRGWSGDDRGTCRIQEQGGGAWVLRPDDGNASNDSTLTSPYSTYADLNANPTYCRDILTRNMNDAANGLTIDDHSDLWVYLMIQVTDNGVQQWILAGDEDEDGTDVDTINNINWLSMRTYGYTHLALPAPMIARYELGAETDSTLNDPMEMEVDWFYYTTSTSVSIWDVRADIPKIRTFLWDNYNATHLSDPIWRFSTVPNADIAAPVVEPASGECYFGVRNNRPTGPYNVTVEEYDKSANEKVFKLVFVDDGTHVYRHNNFNVEWDVTATYKKLDTGTLTTQTLPTNTTYGFRYELTLYNPSDYELQEIQLDGTVTDIGANLQMCQGAAISFTATIDYAAKRGGSTSLTSTTLPTEFKLDVNYPNPFNATTEIQYALPEDAFVTLTVFDALGREVTRLVDGPVSSGYHSITFDASDLPTGNYFYRMEAGAFVEVHQMALIK